MASHTDSPSNERRGDGRRPVSWYFKWLGASAAAAGLVLTLLGYGVAFGFASAFHLDPGMLAASPFEALTGSWPALVMAILDFQSTRQVLKGIWRSDLWTTPLPYILVGASVATAWLVRRKDPAAIREFGQLFRRTNPWSGIAVVSLISALLPLLILMLARLALACALFAIALVPAIGHRLGKEYAQIHVIEAPPCNGKQTVPAHGNRPNNDAAACVTVVPTNGRPHVTGRLASSTGRYVLVYTRNPAGSAGVAHWIPLDGAIVTSVGLAK